MIKNLILFLSISDLKKVRIKNKIIAEPTIETIPIIKSVFFIYVF